MNRRRWRGSTRFKFTMYFTLVLEVRTNCRPWWLCLHEIGMSVDSASIFSGYRYGCKKPTCRRSFDPRITIASELPRTASFLITREKNLQGRLRPGMAFVTPPRNCVYESISSMRQGINIGITTSGLHVLYND
jgi:hypothetical protein